MTLQSMRPGARPPGRSRERVAVPHRRLIISVAAVLAVVVFLSWLVAFSSVFGVKSVAVRGSQHLSPGQVRSAAAISRGTPLVRLDKAAVLRRVQALPDVASARVDTSFPSTVTITITERVAVGYVKKGSRYELVDTSGDQFRAVASKPGKLPLFVVPSGSSSRTTGGAVATVAAALPAAIRAKVASIQALDPEAITLLLTDQRVVRWGAATQNEAKARILPALLKRHGSQFDVTDPSLVVAR